MPSIIEGGFSLGQYSRSIRTNLPAGAGSQLDSFTLPGKHGYQGGEPRMAKQLGVAIHEISLLVEIESVGSIAHP